MKKNNKGQAALIIILVTAVVVTIIVASVGRTVVDVRIATQSEESYQALNAAEAGIERAFLQLKDNPNNTTSNCPTFDDALGDDDCRIQHFNPDTGTLEPSQSIFWYEMAEVYPDPADTAYTLGPIAQGDVATIWLTDQPFADNQTDMFSNLYDDDFTITFSTSGAVSVELSILYEESPGGALLIDRIYKSYNDTSEPIDNTTGGTYDNNAAMIRIRPVTGSLDQVTISGISNFPPQARIIESHGHYLGSGEGDQAISKAIQIVRWHDDLPPWFEYVFYSGGDVIK
ncbi:MAG: hypothetical protein NUV98_03910 [Candidatus Roizmanbacteria bacterium]|nr:hypothetical protein [Candidatus Roizmanbacteria bacterium]